MNQRDYQREYYLKHRESKLAAAKERYWNNRDELLKANKKWRDEHPGYGTLVKNRWRKNNPEKEKALKKLCRTRRRQDPRIRLCESVSFNIKRFLINGKQGKSWSELVDFTPKQLTKHMEKQFQPGMTWANYGQWHIDHIIPVTAFNFNSPKDIDFKRCWALKNLQPMWAQENIRKSNKLYEPFQPSLLVKI